MKSKILMESATLTVQDLTERCRLDRKDIYVYVEEGLIEPHGETPETWRFSETTVIYLQKAQRLQRDLGLNPAGVTLAIELLSEIDVLKNQLQRMNEDD